jgi:hypothetical protein
VVLATAKGILTDADLRVHLGTLTTDTEVQPGFNELYDLREVMEVEITASSVEDVAGFIHEIEQHFKESKTAIVASDRNTAEVSYLYELLRTNAPATIRLFHDLAAAREWLGLPDTRSAPRRQVGIPVLCRTATHEAPARLVNISLSGALLESELLRADRGRLVTIQFPSFEVVGTVVHHTETRFAIDFLTTPDEFAEMLRDLS